MLKLSFPKLIGQVSASRLFSFAVLAVAGLLAYAPGLNGEFLWDDSWLVHNNPFFKSPIFIFEVFRHYLYLDGTSTYYRPLQNISYMPDYWLWHGNSYGYHLSNVFFHVASGWLLFRLVTRLLPAFASANPASAGEPSAPGFLIRCRAEIALLVALIWVVHPIHNAAVAYVAGRADSLASMFALAAWLLYIKARRFTSRTARVAAFAAALFLCVLAVCSKEIAITWFTLFVFYTLVFDKEQRLRAKLAAIAGIVLVVGFCLWLRHLPAGTVSGALPSEAPSPLELRGILALRALGDYTGLIFFPSHLHMDRTVYQLGPYYSVAAWQGRIGSEYLSMIGAVTAALFLFFCCKNLPGRRLRIFGAGWFLIGFLPISNLFPLNAQVAEHWIYMPSFGFLLFVAGCVVPMPKPALMAAIAIALAAVPAFVKRTSMRAYEWADQERFYKQTIDDGGGSARVHLNLALVYSARGDDVTAEKMLRHTLKNSPDYLPARLNLGVNLLRQKRPEEAEPFLKLDKATMEKMARQQAHTWSSALNMAHMRHNAKQTKEALAILDEAIPNYPHIWDVVELKARILREESDVEGAIAAVEAYAKSYWWHYESHMALAKLRTDNGDVESAIEALREAARLDIHAVAPFLEIAGLRDKEKKYEEEADALRRAIRRDPYQLKVYLSLVDAYEHLGRKADVAVAYEEAGDVLRRALRRDPNQSGYLILADIYEHLGRKADAASARRAAEELRSSKRSD